MATFSTVPPLPFVSPSSRYLISVYNRRRSALFSGAAESILHMEVRHRRKGEHRVGKRLLARRVPHDDRPQGNHACSYPKTNPEIDASAPTHNASWFAIYDASAVSRHDSWLCPRPRQIALLSLQDDGSCLTWSANTEKGTALAFRTHVREGARELKPNENWNRRLATSITSELQQPTKVVHAHPLASSTSLVEWALINASCAATRMRLAEYVPTKDAHRLASSCESHPIQTHI